MKHMKRTARFSMLFSLGLAVTAAGAANIKLMTQNQYLGADLAPVLIATDGNAFNTAVVTALQTIAANHPVERMRALAAEIASTQPALVGLQEVYRFQCTDLAPLPPGMGCSDPSIAGAFSDQLQTTLAALGTSYVQAATVVNLNVPMLPFTVNGVTSLLAVVDRDVILARGNVAATPVNYSGACTKLSGDGCNYNVVATANTPLGPISVERGFVAVDATVDGKAYRVVNTHLELQQPDPSNPASQALQALQAAELLQIVNATTPVERALIVLGDMNSSPAHVPSPGIVTPYVQFATAGFADAWTLRPGGLVGYTCCQIEDLSNHRSVLYERIDMIFSFTSPQRVKQARIVGATVSDKTSPPGRGLWPSDHGSVSAELQF